MTSILYPEYLDAGERVPDVVMLQKHVMLWYSVSILSDPENPTKRLYGIIQIIQSYQVLVVRPMRASGARHRELGDL